MYREERFDEREPMMQDLTNRELALADTRYCKAARELFH